jgi:hypothetical protein
MLQYVDFEHPADSKLLAFAITPHGGQTEPALTRDDLAFQLLQRWIYSVSQHPEKYVTDVIQQGTASAAAPNATGPPAPQHDVAPVGFVETVSSPMAPPQPNQQPENRLESPPSDPCDPTPFNRRHDPDRAR